MQYANVTASKPDPRDFLLISQVQAKNRKILLYIVMKTRTEREIIPIGTLSTNRNLMSNKNYYDLRD